MSWGHYLPVRQFTFSHRKSILGRHSTKLLSMEPSVAREFCSQKSRAKCHENEEIIFKALPLREKIKISYPFDSLKFGLFGGNFQKLSLNKRANHSHVSLWWIFSRWICCYSADLWSTGAANPWEQFLWAGSSMACFLLTAWFCLQPWTWTDLISVGGLQPTLSFCFPSFPCLQTPSEAFSWMKVLESCCS